MQRLAAIALLTAPVIAQGWADATPQNPLLRPAALAFAAMCWDEANGYVLLHGGQTSVGLENSTWSYDGSAWTQHATTLPTAQGGGLRSDPVRTAMTFHPPTNSVLLFRSGTWRWTGSDWLSMPITGISGNPRDVALGFDAGRGQTVLYVGTGWVSNGPRTYRGETYVLNGSSWQLQPSAVTPWPMRFPRMATDPATGNLVLTTHDDDHGSSAWFEWNGHSWAQRLPTNAPTAAGVLATNTARGEIVLFDGDLGTHPGHTHVYSSGAVSPAPSALEPAPRFGAMMAYDPLRDRAVLFGGTNSWGEFTNLHLTLGDVWEYEAGASANYQLYGAGCAGSRGVPTLAPKAGSLPRVGSPFDLDVSNLPFTGAVFVFLGISDTTFGPTPLPFALGGLGAPGCSILASGEAPFLVPNLLGSATWQWQTPNAPGVSFFNQAFAFDPAANVLGLSASNAGHGTIGF